MSTKACSVAFVALLLTSLVPLATPSTEQPFSDDRLGDDRFAGFVVSNQDVWNQTPWPITAVPEGFTYDSVTDYSDVGVLINNLSEESRTIGWAYVAARNISLDRVFIFDASGTPTGETINRNQFDTYFASPFLEMLQNRSSNGLNYLVTTKGVPLRVSGGNNKASFDQELSLLGGAYNSTVGGDYWGTHTYGPLAGKAMEPFSRSKYGFFLVTRLTGYTVDTALDLIERANNSLGQRGTFVLDVATNRNESGYKFWNDDLYTANSTLTGMGWPVQFDEETNFLTNVSNVMGYASWGSNDGDWNRNHLPNSGFDTLDGSWQSGSRYWTHTSPTVAPVDGFNWTYQTDTKQGGNGAFEANMRTDCNQDSGKGIQGIYGEYFDNDGVSFSTASMPTLIDRQPDRVQIEANLDHGSSNNAYAGLDDRFRDNWGARFSGLVDVPYTGTWTFFINSDDGSELWLNGASLVTNHGSHGMRERSGQVNLTAGAHEFRIEFFQGTGPHGLKFLWEGPNTPKAVIPSSAFYVTGDVAPQIDRLVHHWAFEDGSGNSVIDNGTGGANLTLSGTDNSNWRSCPDGGCLWFDGTNDVARVEVDDYAGNLTVSQWVWANTTAQTTYASTLAVNDQAGSNASFQHMVSNQQWRLHNNQTKPFGDVVAKRWTHLVTVFDNGDVRQYMDGVLVNEDTYPNGTYTNIDLYKLGVNRAGSAYFEGMIDEVMVWDVALDDEEIVRLRRTIIDNCTLFSGAGTDVAWLETTYSVPSELSGHAWNIHVHGKREGEVNGAFAIVVEGTDGAGTVLSTNTSNDRTFTTSWATETMRMRPDPSASEFTIRVVLDIEATATVGSFFIDSVVLRPIRPHMEWVNGSIADTAVSTGGRSFEWGTSYGQSLVADLLEDGVSGVKGYVYEPYLTAVGLPSTFLPTYASGYNLAESHAAANLYTGWMGVVVGDPKMAPYTNVLHDVNLVAARSVGDVNLGEPTTVEVLVENLGMSGSNGTLEIRTVLGNSLLTASPLVLPAGDETGSRTTVNVSIVPPNSGYLDLRIRYVNATPERNYANNLRSLSLEVNAPPVIDDVYCSASSLARGGYTICTVEASDDTGIASATLQWQILDEDQTVNESNWSVSTMGGVSSVRWETTLVVPTDAPLGSVTVRAEVTDLDSMTVNATKANVTQIVDAPPTWFGPHASGVDPDDWNNASGVPNKPNAGLHRHEPSVLTACVMDADYRLDSPYPRFMTSRGVLSNVTYVSQSASDLYCYTARLTLETGSDLDDVEVEVRTAAGSLLLQRTLRVADKAPELQLSMETTDGEPLDRVVGNGEERVRITVTDLDDPETSFVGDVTLHWPGGEPIQLPLDVSPGDGVALVPLNQVMIPLEAGDLAISASGRGQHGATAAASIDVPFLLTPPAIVSFEACDGNGRVENMTFGQTATLVVGLTSDRPLQSMSAQLTQSGWAVVAPSVSEPVWGRENVPATCPLDRMPDENVQWLYFRLKLDNSLVDGEGRAVFTVSDLDGLVKSQSLDLMFQHAPTLYERVDFSDAVPGTDLHTNVTVSDLDGLEQVICAYNLYGEDGALLTQSVVQAGPEGAFVNELTYRYPVPLSLGNTTLNLNLTCMDNLQQAFHFSASVDVGPSPACLNCDNQTANQRPAAEVETSGRGLLLGGAALIVAAGVGGWMLRRRSDTGHEPSWDDENELNPLLNTEGLFDEDEGSDVFDADANEVSHDDANELVPEGWTMEEFVRWLEGPVPEGWTEVQWATYVETSTAALAQKNTSAEG